jgi:hypothetical protein
MRVRAKALCYFNEYTHEAGDVFDITDGIKFSDATLEQVDESTPLSRPGAPPPLPPKRFPPSGTGEVLEQTDNILPDEEPEMEVHTEKAGRGKRK